MRTPFTFLLPPLLALALLALALLPRPGTAQVRFDGVDLSAGYFGWESDQFEDVEGGPRFGLIPMFRIGDLWNVGVEGVYADSEVQLVDIPIFIEENGLNAIVRHSFSDPNDVHVFLQARGGWSRLESEIAEGEDFSVVTFSQTGYALGAEFGVGFPAGRYIDVQWAGSLGWNSYDACEIFGETLQYRWVTFGESCSAIRWGVRVGLVLGRSEG